MNILKGIYGNVEDILIVVIMNVLVVCFDFFEDDVYKLIKIFFDSLG